MTNIRQEEKIDLVRIASEVRKWAYVPYSKYQVGAAVLTDSGKIYDGVNIENAAFPVTVCAERTAVFTCACFSIHLAHSAATLAWFN